MRSDCFVALLAFVVRLPGQAEQAMQAELKAAGLGVVEPRVAELGVAELEQVEKRIHPILMPSHHHPNLATIRAATVLNLSRRDQRHYSIVFAAVVWSTIPAPALRRVAPIVELQGV